MIDLDREVRRVRGISPLLWRGDGEKRPSLIESTTRSMSGRCVSISCESTVSVKSASMCSYWLSALGRYQVRRFQLRVRGIT